MSLKEYQIMLFMMTFLTVIVIASFFATCSTQQALAETNITNTTTKTSTNVTNATNEGGITSGGSAGEDEAAGGEDTRGG